mmetsp:Transcript_108868/g.184628  ORF Transcript_108868/g.184628 Transcript_108868/m.184628 type:complete len:96 (-) Transcript_108868:443-730(-)
MPQSSIRELRCKRDRPPDSTAKAKKETLSCRTALGQATRACADPCRWPGGSRGSDFGTLQHRAPAAADVEQDAALRTGSLLYFWASFSIMRQNSS